MPFRLELLPHAARQLRGFPAGIRDRISERIAALAENPRPPGVRKLQGTDRYRLRVGDYRVLYVIDEDLRTVTIASVGHRREVYR